MHTSNTTSPEQETMSKPIIVVGVSGKRFSGKDTFSHEVHTKLQTQTTLTSEIGTISQVFKKEFANKFGYDYHRIMTDRVYKEHLREKMNAYFHELMAKDPSIDDKWWNELIQHCDKDVIICPDIRLKSDISSLSNISGCKLILVRLICSDDIRIKLGWEYNKEVDTDQTGTYSHSSASLTTLLETDLDTRTTWDYEFVNDGVHSCLETHATALLPQIIEAASTL